MKLTARQWMYRNIYLRSPYWRWVRRQVARRAGYACQVRGCRIVGHNLDAHHTVYVLWLEWLPWNWRKMEYLCRFHHNKTHRGMALELKSGRTLKGYGTR